MRELLSYFKENVSRTFRDWGKAELLFALLAYVVISVGSFFSLAVVHAMSSRIVLAIGIAAIACFGGLFFFVTPARILQEDRRTMASLRQRLAPKLEMLFSQHESPFEQITPLVDLHGDRFVERRYRVGIKNAGETTIDDIGVEIDMEQIAFRPVPLHLMHDNPGEGQPYQRTFDLNPGETKYIDVLARYEGEGRTNDEIILLYAVSGIPNLIPPDRHELTIAAHGRNIPRCTRSFLVYVNEENRLRFMPLAT